MTIEETPQNDPQSAMPLVEPTPTPTAQPPVGVAQTKSSQPEIIQAPSLPASPSNNRVFYSSVLNVYLTEDDAKNPIVQKFMFQEITRLETEVGELKDFRDKFNKEHTRAEVQAETIKSAADVGDANARGRMIADVLLAVLMCAVGVSLCHFDTLPATDLQGKGECVVAAVVLTAIAIFVKVKAK
jgi:hypothetical protein